MKQLHDDPSFRAWIHTLAKEGWLGEQDVVALQTLEQETPEASFTRPQQRPLVVAMFGGTGTGKSSLLNRMAGPPIATTGVTRPTSTDVVIHLHTDTLLAQLPEGLATAGLRINRHHESRLRHLVLMDTPDIDSIETDHHKLTLQWLQTVDIVIYVVSPERYRDHRGWSLLQQASTHCGWMFCFNQWDRADPAQWVDFIRIIHQEGFAHPLCFRTQATERLLDDDFDSMLETLDAMAAARLPEQLALARRRERQQAWLTWLDGMAVRLAVPDQSTTTVRAWQTSWPAVADTIQSGLAWRLPSCLDGICQGRLQTLAAEAPSPSPLWDDYANITASSSIRQLQATLHHAGIPVGPLNAALSPILQQLGATVCSSAEAQLRRALATPGGRLRRGLHRSFTLLSLVLPSLAALWVCSEVVTQYWHSTQTGADWLDSRFALHSTLLIAILWLLPWLLARLCMSSAHIESSGLKALQKGLQQGLDTVASQVEAAIDSMKDQAADHARHCDRYRQQIHEAHDSLDEADTAARPWMDKIIARRG